MNKKLYKKLVVLDSVIFFPEHRRRLEAMADEIVEYNTCTSEKEVSDRCKGADCIISCWVDIPRRIIEDNPQLRTIAFWTHDYEHRIDATFARKCGIHVPAIPDYGTDSVAELVFIGLLNLFAKNKKENSAPNLVEESVVARIGDDVRLFSKNVKDTLDGRWLHEYIKTGQRRIIHPDEIPEETLKGLTVGILDKSILNESLIEILSNGFRMNLIYSLFDESHNLDVSFRPIDRLLEESQVLIYDERTLLSEHRNKLDSHPYLSKINLGNLQSTRRSLKKLTMGIVGLGRIGCRVAQIASQGFGMNVKYFSRTPKKEFDKALGIRSTSLDEVLTNSDIISFHLPHHGTEGFISSDLVKKIPDGTTVINASVGNILEDEPLFLKRFSEGALRGYVDVYKTLPPRLELRTMRDYLVATYRLGWRTKSTVGLKTHKLLTKIENLPEQRTIN